ncbi:MAG: hypothetical protein R3D25_12670 [Geminicoccaceae bacterium]
MPDEDWVILGYRHAAGEAEIRLPWSMLEAPHDPGLRFAIQTVWLFEKDTSGGKIQARYPLNHAMNIRTQVEQVTRRHLFSAKKKAPGQRQARDSPRLRLPDLMTFSPGRPAGAEALRLSAPARLRA